jgi:hypothetical protein
MGWARLIFEQIKAFLLEQLEEDGGSERAKREVTKRCNIVVAKALLLFDGFLSLLKRTDNKDLPPPTGHEGPTICNKSHVSMADTATICHT